MLAVSFIRASYKCLLWQLIFLFLFYLIIILISNVDMIN